MCPKFILVWKRRRRRGVVDGWSLRRIQEIMGRNRGIGGKLIVRFGERVPPRKVSGGGHKVWMQAGGSG